MTQNGVNELYNWLTASWPLVIRPQADEEWKRAKKRELYTTFKDYDDRDVISAFERWTEREPHFPTTSDIINEIKWYQVKSKIKASEGATYQMPVIFDDGNEYIIDYNGKINFTWDEFKNLPRNKEHLDPDEWERRYDIRRRHILRRLVV